MAERKNITQPTDWWDAFVSQAEKKGLTLSEWVGECCLDKLPRSVVAKLSERPPAHRPRQEKD